MRSRKVRLRRLYDSTSSSYEALYGLEQLRKLQAILKCLSLNRMKANVVLDAGCGTGLAISHLHDKVSMMVGVDFSKGMLSKAKERFKMFRKVDFVLGDIEFLPFRPRSFDIIISLTVLQNCAHPVNTLRSLIRTLSKKGMLIVSYLKSAQNMLDVETRFGKFILRDIDDKDNVLILNARDLKGMRGYGSKEERYGFTHQIHTE